MIAFDEMDKVADSVLRYIDESVEAATAALAGKAPGHRNLSGVALIAFFARMAEEYPAEEWIAPDGSVHTISPWAVAQLYVEDGPRDLAALERALESVAEGVFPQRNEVPADGRVD